MIKRSSHSEARHDDAGRPTSEAARDRAEAAKSIVTWKLDTTFSVRVEMTWKQFVRKE